MNIATLTPHQKLCVAAWCQMFIDALSDAQEGTAEYEEQVLSDWQITQKDHAFIVGCDILGFDYDYVIERYLAGDMTRDGVYYLMNRLTN